MANPLARSRSLIAFLAGSLFAILPAGRLDAVPPISLTVSGTYGSPVAPPSPTVAHGFGFNALVDYNPMNMISVGVGFESIRFDGSPISTETANLELKLFPFENGKKYFSPYITGGAGLNLSAVGNNTPFKLKAGLGTRVSLISALYLDMGFESHWFVDPGASQYVGARAGLSYSFEFEPGKQDALVPQSQKKAPEKVAPKEDPKAKTEASSVGSGSEIDIAKAASKQKPSEDQEAKEAPEDLEVENVPMRGAKPTATPEEEAEEEEAQEETSVEDTEMMKLYRSGTKSYLKSDYSSALRDLRKCVAIEDDAVKPLYYSEANALIGVIHHVKKDDATAVKFYRKALALNPQNHAALKYLRKLGVKIVAPKAEEEAEESVKEDEASSEDETTSKDEAEGEEEGQEEVTTEEE